MAMSPETLVGMGIGLATFAACGTWTGAMVSGLREAREGRERTDEREREKEKKRKEKKGWPYLKP